MLIQDSRRRNERPCRITTTAGTPSTSRDRPGSIQRPPRLPGISRQCDWETDLLMWPDRLVRSAIARDKPCAARRTPCSGCSGGARHSLSPAGCCPSAHPSGASRPQRHHALIQRRSRRGYGLPIYCRARRSMSARSVSSRSSSTWPVMLTWVYQSLSSSRSRATRGS